MRVEVNTDVDIDVDEIVDEMDQAEKIAMLTCWQRNLVRLSISQILMWLNSLAAFTIRTEEDPLQCPECT